MNELALQRYLIRLFEQHEVALAPDEEWLLTDDDFPAIQARWQPGSGQAPGRLDVDVVVDESRQIEASFAGSGEGEQACRQALAAFEHALLPVLLAALWYVTDTRRLQLRQWTAGVTDYDVFVGRPWLQGVAIENLPGDIEEVLGEAFKREGTTPQLHWIGWFYRQDAGAPAQFEVLLDNAPWAAGEQALARLGWPLGAGGYRARGHILVDVRDYD